MNPFSAAQIAAFHTWRREPSTIAGFSILSSLVSAVMSGHLTAAAAAPWIVGAVVAMAMRETPPTPNF